MKSDDGYVLIDHVIGSFVEGISLMGKPNKAVFTSVLLHEQRMPEIELLGIEPISRKIVINYKSDTH